MFTFCTQVAFLTELYGAWNPCTVRGDLTVFPLSPSSPAAPTPPRPYLHPWTLLPPSGPASLPNATAIACGRFGLSSPSAIPFLPHPFVRALAWNSRNPQTILRGQKTHYLPLTSSATSLGGWWFPRLHWKHWKLLTWTDLTYTERSSLALRIERLKDP